MDSMVASNVACRVLPMHSTGGEKWYTNDGVAYDLYGHQAYGKPILIAQSKLNLIMLIHDWLGWPCIYLEMDLAPSHLLGGKISSPAVA